MKALYLTIFISTQFLAYDVSILNTKVLEKDKINDITVSELSALAYDNEHLYALSDSGNLFKYEIDFKNKNINSLKLLEAFRLKNKKNKILKKNKSDSEGMAYVDNKLLISFERKPRIEYFSLDGKKIKNVKINQELLDEDIYLDNNKMLEAVTYNDKYGVVTSPELPLKKYDKCSHKLYTKDKIYDLKFCSNITALEFINEDELLVLFRDMQLVIYNLMTSKIEYVKSHSCFNGYKFEGLTKLEDNLYLIVSDNDDSSSQKTLFVLFEILYN